MPCKGTSSRPPIKLSSAASPYVAGIRLQPGWSWPEHWCETHELKGLLWFVILVNARICGSLWVGSSNFHQLGKGAISQPQRVLQALLRDCGALSPASWVWGWGQQSPTLCLSPSMNV